MALWHRIGIVTLANHADSITALLLPKPIYIYILRIFSTTQEAACIGQDITEELRRGEVQNMENKSSEENSKIA